MPNESRKPYLLKSNLDNHFTQFENQKKAPLPPLPAQSAEIYNSNCLCSLHHVFEEHEVVPEDAQPVR